MNDSIEDLIESKRGITLIRRIEQSDTIRTQMAAYYEQAVEARVILLLITLAKTGVYQASEWRWSEMFNNRPLVIQVTDEYSLTARIGDDVVCQNWPPGSEMLIPGRWLILCREALEQWEANQSEKARLAIATAKAEALRKQLAKQIEDVRILNVDI